MENNTPISSILHRKGTHVWSIAPEASVYEAIALMAEKDIGALAALKGGQLVGTLSERDYTRKVVLLGRASKQTAVAEIMNTDLVTVVSSDSVEDCMQLMTNRRRRHLPVVEGGRLVGMLSIGDLVNWIISMQAVAINDLENFVTGAYPG